MSHFTTALRALSGNLSRDLERLGVVRADQIRPGWVVRTPGHGRGKRWWVREVRGPAGEQGLVRLSAQLVEVHGVRSRAGIRRLGANPDTLERIYLEDAALVVIDYLDWNEADSGD